MYQATLRKFEANQDDTISKAEDPGKFMDERTWPEQEIKLDFFLSTIPGVNSVPLPYAVQAQAAPGHTTYFQGKFIADTIACTPLSGGHFQADTRKVHTLQKNYLVAETAEQWISSINNCVSGWDDYNALCRHYSSGGNVIRHVTTADCFQETLH